MPLSGSEANVPGGTGPQAGRVNPVTDRSSISEGNEANVPGDMGPQAGRVNPIAERNPPSEGADVAISRTQSQVGIANPVTGPSTSSEAKQYMNPTVNEVHLHYYDRGSKQEASSSSFQQPIRSSAEETGEVEEVATGHELLTSPGFTQKRVRQNQACMTDTIPKKAGRTGKELLLTSGSIQSQRAGPSRVLVEEAVRNGPVIGLFDRRSNTIQTFKPTDKSWNVRHNVPEEISGKSWFCAIAVDQIIFVLSLDCSNFKFDPSKPEGWIALPKRSESDYIQAVELGGQVYAFHNEGMESASIEILDAEHTSWRKTNKAKPCYDEAIAAAKGFIYTFGGSSDGQWRRRSMKFEPNINKWMDLPDMPTARFQAAATTLGDKIYVVGGSDRWKDLETSECFDVVTETWTTLKPMNNRHYHFNAFAFGDKVYAVGSFYHTFIIEEYNPATDTWNDVITVSEQDVPSKATFVLPT